MAVVREHGSVVASLAELRMIEEQRVADERTAMRERERRRVEAIAAAERDARTAAERANREAHAALLARETARLEAEREGRMRMEAAAGAEQARQLMMLASERAAREHELRRAEVARQRPTWMVVVTTAAIAVAGVLVWFAFEKASASAEAERQRSLAEQDKLAAVAKQRDVQRGFERQRDELAAIERGVTEARRRLDAAQTKADLAAAQADYDRQQKLLADKRQRDKDAADKAAHAARLAPIDLSACAHDALGCVGKR